MEAIFDKETKNRIFRSAIDLFSKEGYNAVSIRDIAQDVGIKSASLYNHFESKENILEEIFNYFKKKIEDTQIEFDNEIISRSSVLDILKNYIILFGRSLTPEMDKIFRIIMMEQYRNQRARDFLINELLRNRSDFFSKLIDKMIEFGKIKNIDSKKYGEIINYAFFSLSIEYNCDKMTNNVKEIENKIFNFIDTVGLILSKE